MCELKSTVEEIKEMLDRVFDEINWNTNVHDDNYLETLTMIDEQIQEFLSFDVSFKAFQVGKLLAHKKGVY